MANIKDLDKAELLAKLYNDAQHIGLDADHRYMTLEDAQEVIDEAGLSFDTLGGRAIHMDLSGDEIDTTLYNQMNGHAAAESAVETVRQRGYAADDVALEEAVEELRV